MEDVIGSCHHRSQSESIPALGFYNDDDNDNYVSDNDGHEDAFDVVEEQGRDKLHDEEGMQVLMYLSEAEKKNKKRTKERAWFEKEGGKRRNEGHPRNFLLVDEYTKIPYEVGMDDWKKELMLLSRDLDPSIGNINRQPKGSCCKDS